MIFRFGENGRMYVHGQEVVLATEVERLLAALTEVRDATFGQVCQEYEVCEHQACRASYNAWALADEALSPVEEG